MMELPNIDGRNVFFSNSKQLELKWQQTQRNLTSIGTTKRKFSMPLNNINIICDGLQKSSEVTARDVVLEAVRQYGYALEYASKEPLAR